MPICYLSSWVVQIIANVLLSQELLTCLQNLLHFTFCQCLLLCVFVIPSNKTSHNKEKSCSWVFTKGMKEMNKCQKLWSFVVFAPELFIGSNFICFILWFHFLAKSCKIYEKMELGHFSISLFARALIYQIYLHTYKS